MAESKFRRKIVKELERHNAVVIPYVAHMRNRPGVPDCHVIHKWWSGWIEFKDVSTALRKDQQLVMREMNRRVPATAFIVRAPGIVESEELKELFRFESVREMLEGIAAIKQECL